METGRHVPRGPRGVSAAASTLLVGLALAGAPAAAEFVASPDGRPDGNGSLARPWDIATAFGHPREVKPGDTIWLRGGTYAILGTLTGRLRGTPERPVVVRQMRGERATLDTGASAGNRVAIKGEHAWYWGFEVTSSADDRWADEAPYGGIERGGGIDVYGSRGVRLINLVIHDAQAAVGFWAGAVDGEVYGCIIYYTGFDAEDRGHGHAIYAQNREGTKRLVDNIMFSQYSHGIHAYGSARAYLDNFHIEGNISFNNGCVSTVSGPTRNILVGGGRTARNPKVIDNCGYFPPEARGGRSCDCGYGKGTSNLVATGNYFASGGYAFRVKDPDATVTDNVFIGDVQGIPAASGEGGNRFVPGGRAAKGVDVVVRPNRYEPGRAHIAVFNWDRRPVVHADVSAVLKKGDLYELRDAQNYFGPAVAAGVFGGRPIAVPMDLAVVAQPVGEPARPVAHTAPRFGAFVLTMTGRKGALP